MVIVSIVGRLDRVYIADCASSSHKRSYRLWVFKTSVQAYFITCQVAVSVRKMKETGLKFSGFGPNSMEIFSPWYFEQFPGVIDWNKQGFALPDVEEP